jgi:peroxin-19
MLDDFSTVKLEPKKPEVQAAAPKPEPTAAPSTTVPPVPSLEDDLSEEEFAKQLQAGMASLLGELEKSASHLAHGRKALAHCSNPYL